MLIKLYHGEHKVPSRYIQREILGGTLSKHPLYHHSNGNPCKNRWQSRIFRIQDLDDSK